MVAVWAGMVRVSRKNAARGRHAYSDGSTDANARPSTPALDVAVSERAHRQRRRGSCRKREVDLFQCTKARNPTRQNPTPKKRARRKNAARADPRHRSCPTLAINSEMRCPGVAKVARR